jgi:hypothetical protein
MDDCRKILLTPAGELSTGGATTGGSTFISVALCYQSDLRLQGVVILFAAFCD